MRWTGEEPVISAAFNKAAQKPDAKQKAGKTRKRRETSVLTLRVTKEERAKLEELAAGMTLSAYIRACVFAEEAKRRKKRPKDVVADKKALAECLALLGHSRMASNLNQLAYQANIGALVLDIETKSEIDEAYEC